MKSWSIYIAVCCALVVAGASRLSAQEDSVTIQSKIVAMEKGWNQAFKLRDTKAIDTLLADEVVLVNDDGSVQNKADFLRFVRQSKPSDEEQVTPESIKVHVVGEVAIATGVFQSKGIENGKPFVKHDRFVDTWIKRGGNWVCASASATPVLH
jgi:ketosteroid isomerase-like protein